MAVILTYVEQVLFLKQREQLVHKMKTREKCTDININLFCEKFSRDQITMNDNTSPRHVLYIKLSLM